MHCSVLTGCEKIICEKLDVDKVASILSWSGEPHGSSWVHRQALCYLREEFQAISTSPSLFELQRKHLVQAIRSDFLQVRL